MGYWLTIQNHITQAFLYSAEVLNYLADFWIQKPRFKFKYLDRITILM
ncbi:MAG: hypothetical protein ACFFB0_19725 [Promethearchaeota archaeon]